MIQDVSFLKDKLNRDKKGKKKLIIFAFTIRIVRLLRWRSSVVEQLICNQRVRGSNPFASSSSRENDSPLNPISCVQGGKRGFLDLMGRYPSGQREQTVNLPSYDFGGSNPPLPTKTQAGVTQWLESQPSKLLVAGSSPVSRSFFFLERIFRKDREGGLMKRPRSSVVEHFLGKEEVTGSSPVVGLH